MKYNNIRNQILKFQEGKIIDNIFSAKNSRAIIPQPSDILLTAASFIPGVGEVMDAAGVVKGLITGNLTEAALNAIGLILPGVSGKSLEVGKKAISILGQEGAEKLGKSILSAKNNISPKSKRILEKKFGASIKDLTKGADEVVTESAKQFKASHGYDKDDIIREMSELHNKRDSESDVLNKAVIEATQKARSKTSSKITKRTKNKATQKAESKTSSKIIERTKNEEYLDTLYELQNGRIDWPIFIKGKPNARDVIEAAIQDKSGRGVYVAVSKGSGDLNSRTSYTINRSKPYGNMLYLTTDKNVAANYSYSTLGLGPEQFKANKKIVLDEYEKALINEGKSKQQIKQLLRKREEELDSKYVMLTKEFSFRVRMLNQLEDDLRRRFPEKSDKQIKERAKEIQQTFEEIQDIYNEKHLKQGLELTNASQRNLTKTDVTEQPEFEGFTEDFLFGPDFVKKKKEKKDKKIKKELTDDAKETLSKLTKLHERASRLLGESELRIGQVKSGIVKINLNDTVAQVDWGGHGYKTGSLQFGFTGNKNKKYASSNKLVRDFYENDVDVGIIENVADPYIVGTNIVVRDPGRFIISRKIGGGLNYFEYFK